MRCTSRWNPPGALAAFFDARRAEADVPSARFIETVFADALAARPAPAPALTVRVRDRDRPFAPISAFLQPFGGWGAAAGLAGCLALGFLAGSLGAGSDLAASALWPDLLPVEAGAVALDDFFDLTVTEG